MPTNEELDIIRHALTGGTGREYRNHYCAAVEPGDLDHLMILDMVRRGLMKAGRTINDGRAQYFHVTEEGRAALARGGAGA